MKSLHHIPKKLQTVVVLILLSLMLPSCFSDYVYYLSDDRATADFQFADTMGVKFFIRNQMYIKHRQSKLVIKRDNQIVDMDEIKFTIDFGNEKCEIITECSVAYGDSLKKYKFQGYIKSSGPLQNSIVITDTYKKPASKYKWLEYWLSLERICGYDSEKLQNVKANINIRMMIDGKELNLKKIIDYKKVKYKYSRLDGFFDYYSEEK